MNVCFVANKHLTITFAKVARQLEEQGHRIFWASPSRRWTEWLIAFGVRSETILSIDKFAAEWRDGRCDLDELATYETPELPMWHNIILMCRGLREIEATVARSYLLVAARRFGEFARQHDLDVVFGEATWGFEFAVALSAAKNGVEWMTPNSTRIPDDRFAFFKIYPHQIIALKPVVDEDRKWAAEFHDKWRARPRPPSYSRRVPTPLKWRAHWLEDLRVGLLQRRLDADDLTLWPLSLRISRRFKRGVASLAVRFNPPFDQESDRPFVLMCLHQQPEASVDVAGAFHSDQAQAIRRLSRLLPSTHELWVKEHPDAPGARGLRWFRDLAALANVRFIRPEAPTFELCRRASMVVAVSGTVAYESALLGTPAATLSPIFFGPVLSVDAALAPDPLCWDLPSLLDKRRPADEVRTAAIEFLAWVHAQSFPGIPFDPGTRKLLGRDPEDVHLEAAGFIAALASIEHRRKTPGHVHGRKP